MAKQIEERLSFSSLVGWLAQLFFLFTRPMKMEQTEYSETSAHKIWTLGNHPKGRIQQRGSYFRSKKVTEEKPATRGGTVRSLEFQRSSVGRQKRVANVKSFNKTTSITVARLIFQQLVTPLNRRATCWPSGRCVLSASLT
jgi:hypothetical protein